MGKTITELIQAFTECGIARRTWNGSTSIVDQNVSVDNVLSNPHRNNGVSKVLGIFLSDFVSHGSEQSLWRHHGHENNQLKSARCQRKASPVSGRHICTVWHSAGISGKCRDIGIDFSGIAARPESGVSWDFGVTRDQKTCHLFTLQFCLHLHFGEPGRHIRPPELSKFCSQQAWE